MSASWQQCAIGDCYDLELPYETTCVRLPSGASEYAGEGGLWGQNATGQSETREQLNWRKCLKEVLKTLEMEFPGWKGGTWKAVVLRQCTRGLAQLGWEVQKLSKKKRQGRVHLSIFRLPQGTNSFRLITCSYREPHRKGK